MWTLVSTWALGQLKKSWLTILWVLAAVGTVLAVLAKAKNAGRTVEKVEQLQQQAKVVREQAKVETKVIQEVTNARKEVSDAAARGDVPERVRKFYID